MNSKLSTKITIFVSLPLLLAVFCFLGLPGQAAVQTIVTGTVTYPGGSPASGATVEMHNSTIMESTTTAGDGTYSIAYEETSLDGQEINVEVRDLTGYFRPSGENFTYTLGDSTRTYDFQYILAPKTINVHVQDEDGNPIHLAQVNCYSTTSSSYAVSNNTDVNGDVSLSTVGGTHQCIADANLSDYEADNYPWVYTGKSKEIIFNTDSTSESDDLIFTVTRADSLISGRFLDQYGQPLTGGSFQADITFKREDGVMTRRKVDHDGIFHVYLTPGVWTIWPFPHQSQQYETQSWPNTTITVTEGDAQELGDIQAIVRGSRITGTLVDQDGNPLGGAHLIITRENTPQREFRNTSEDGTYNISVGPGTYTIGRGDVGFIGGYQFDRAATVYIPDNETTVEDVDFVAHQFDMNISGNIKDGSIAVNDLAGTVIAKSDDGSYTASGTIDANGAYQVRIATSLLGDDATKMLLDVKTQEGADYYSPQPTEINITHVSTTQDIEMDPDNAALTGNITDLTGENITDLGTNVKVVAVSSNGSVEKAAVNSQGEYSLTVPDGEYILGLEIADNDESNIIPANGNYLTTEVSAGQTQEINFPTPKKEATVSGTVLDDDGVAVSEAPITITNAFTETDPGKIVYVDTQTDREGNYSAEVPAGDFTINVGSNPRVEDLIEPKKEEITVNAGETKEVDDLSYQASDATLTGTISADQNIISAKVMAFSEDGGFMETEVVDGSYSLPLKKNDWKIIASGLVNGVLYTSELTEKTIDQSTATENMTLVTTGQEVPGVVSTSGDADEAISLTNAAGASVSLDPYAAGFSGTIDVDLIPVPDVSLTSDGGIQANIAYEVVINNSDLPVHQLQLPATITVPLVDQPLVSDQTIDNNKLSAQYWSPNEESWQSNGVIGVIDPANNQATFQVDHLTKFALIYSTSNAPTTPTNLRVTKRTAKKANLHWDGDADSYTVKVSKRAKNKKTTYHPAKTLKKLTDLTTNQAYKWRVKACNGDECSEYSAYDYFRTKPAKASDLNYDETTGLLSWQTVRGKVNYRIKLMDADGKKISTYVVKQSKKNRTRRSYSLNLEEGQIYKVKIRTRYNAKNISDWTKAITMDLR